MQQCPVQQKLLPLWIALMPPPLFAVRRIHSCEKGHYGFESAVIADLHSLSQVGSRAAPICGLMVCLRAVSVLSVETVGIDNTLATVRCDDHSRVVLHFLGSHEASPSIPVFCAGVGLILLNMVAQVLHLGLPPIAPIVTEKTGQHLVIFQGEKNDNKIMVFCSG